MMFPTAVSTRAAKPSSISTACTTPKRGASLVRHAKYTAISPNSSGTKTCPDRAMVSPVYWYMPIACRMAAATRVTTAGKDLTGAQSSRWPRVPGRGSLPGVCAPGLHRAGR